MNYLAQLIDHLDPDELAQFKAIEPSAREQEVLKYLVANPTADRRSALDSLSISPSHFDKLCSQLLTRSYETLAPGDVYARFDLLRSKGLWAHLEHEFKKEEKKVDEGGENAFYFGALRYLAFYTYEKRYAELVEHCCSKLLSHSPSDAQCSVVESIRAQIKFHYVRSASRPFEEQDRAEQTIWDHRDRAFATNDPIARHYQLNSEGYVCLLTSEGGKGAKIFTEALEEVEANASIVLPGERTRILAQLAEALYYDDKLIEGGERYAALFAARPQEIISPHYHVVKYAQILITFERYEEAETLLFRYFPRSIFKSNDRRSAAGAINLAKLYLTWGKLDEVSEFIEIGRETNIKAEVIPYEVQLRWFDILLRFSRGQHDQAHEQMEKLIRYGREKNMFLSANDLPPIMEATRILVRSKSDGDADMDHFEHLTLNVLTGFNRHAAAMLRRVRERAP
jgi:hypothetical protein